jgi:hypothetical protein
VREKKKFELCQNAKKRRNGKEEEVKTDDCTIEKKIII